MSALPHSFEPVPFVGATLKAIEPLENILYLRFSQSAPIAEELSLGVECAWLVQNFAGEAVGRSEGSIAPPLPIRSVVTSAVTRAGRDLEFRFENGLAFVVLVSDGPYESFSVPELNIYV